MSTPIDQVSNLRQTADNQAVQNLLESRTIQPKLTIGQPGDKYELEADRMAEQVMRMPDSVCPTCSETKKEEAIQQKGENSGTAEMSPGIESSITSLRGHGEPLSESVRNYFEPRFGYDFSDVRLHAGNQAVRSAHSIHSKAFTFGKDIVFNKGYYFPDTESGKSLLAHELTHVIQQNTNATGLFIQRTPADEVTQMTIIPSYAEILSDKDLLLCINALIGQLRTLSTESPEYDSARSNLAIMESEAASRFLISSSFSPLREPQKSVKTFPYDSEYGPSDEHCASYQSPLAKTWLTYSYRNNATCACLRTPNEPHNNCVRKCLQVKMIAHFRKQSRMGRALPLTFPLEADPMCRDMWKQHVECYRECGCDSEFINYLTFSTMCRSPFPCAAVATSIDWFNACIK